MSALPVRMKAIEIATAGGPEVLRPGERPVPRPGDGEVLIEVAAAGVNRPDVEQRKGTYPPPPGASDIPGLEIAGTVTALGPDAGGLKIGDQVCALVSGGGYAGYCTAPVPQCLPVPKGLGMVEAAALPETFFTVWQNVFDRARLKAGETILIHGGSSGRGTTAIQMAKAMGAARVLATAGPAQKCKACAGLGVDRAINDNAEDFVEVTVAEAKKKGVDVILDMVGGKYFERNVAALAIEGRLSVIALLGGRDGKLDLGL